MAGMRLAIATAVALVVTGGALAATGDYPGTSQALAPTPGEIAFTSVVSFKPAKKPTGALAKGFKNGVVAFYQKGNAANPVQAITTIYVYKTAADAKHGYASTCGAACPSHDAYKGIETKAGTVKQSGATTLHFATTCRNVLVSIVAAGETVKALSTDAVTIGRWVLKRALGMGMSPCA